MNQSNTHRNPHGSARLHPFVYLALVGAALAFALALWGFASDRYTDYILVIVSGFALVAIGIPTILSRVGTHDPGADPRPNKSRSFWGWWNGDFETWQGKVKGANAVIEILLPLLATAIGMVALGVVLHLTIHGGA